MMLLSIFISLLLAAGVFYLVYRSDKKKQVPYPIVTAALRALLFLLLCLFILAPFIQKTNTTTLKPKIVFLQDNSSSVEKALGSEKKNYEHQVKQLLQKLAKKYDVISWNLDQQGHTDSLFNWTLSKTNLLSPIEKINSQYEAQNLAALIVATDGWYNEGADPSYYPLHPNTLFYPVALGDTSIHADVAITKTYANKTVGLNNDWDLSADIIAEQYPNTQTKVQLLDESGQLLQEQHLNINHTHFSTTLNFTINAKKAGWQQFQLVVKAFDDEKNKVNNQKNIAVEVIEKKKKILVLYESPHPDIHALTAALKPLKHFELTVLDAQKLPTDWSNYDAIIAHQLPSNNSKLPDALWKEKNIWFLSGSQNNYFLLNKAQNLIQFTSGERPNTLYPQLNSSFYLFNLSPEYKHFFEQLTPLQQAHAVQQSAPANQNLIYSSDNSSIWVFQQGQLHSSVLAAEGLWRWRMYDFKLHQNTELFDQLICKTVEFISSPAQRKALQVSLNKWDWIVGEPIQFKAHFYTPSAELNNSSSLKLNIKDSAAHSKSYLFSPTGNSYSLNIGALAKGKYHYQAEMVKEGKHYQDQGSFMVQDLNIEALNEGCNYTFLNTWAHHNSGKVFTSNQLNSLADSLLNNPNIVPIIVESKENAPIINWKFLFFVILFLASLEWFLRKYWLAH